MGHLTPFDSQLRPHGLERYKDEEPDQEDLEKSLDEDTVEDTRPTTAESEKKQMLESRPFDSLSAEEREWLRRVRLVRSPTASFISPKC